MSSTTRSEETPAAARGLSARSLVTIGVFTAIYFVVMFGTGMLGLIGPAVQFVGFLLGALINGTVLMLFMVKTPVMGAMTVLGAVVGLLMLLTGHFWATLLFTTVLGAAADLIVRSGGYRSRSRNCLAYAVFELWMLGPLLPIFYASDSYFADVASSMGQQYADEMQALFTPWLIVVFMAVVFVVSLVSAWIGTRILDRNFAKAGIL
ncbi:MptD family putative ECF transporter S component [Schaalia naturae]|uniref:MptD family putative ECF transporter S component n=1 Tax=Schaalia naturae TaxID=635203 RepID=A0ABW2SJU6_9ACTO